MNVSKKIFFVLGCIILSITLIISIQTYAKYLTAASGDGNVSIARWNISVNNLSIKNTSDISSTIQPFFPGNENMAPEIVAPNAEGYFDLNLDFTKVDVSFEYSITVVPSAQSLVKDLVATGYSIDDGEVINLDDTHKLTQNINFTTKPETQKVRIFIKWIEDSNSQMDNVEDTQAAISSNPIALLNVALNFKQT